MRSFTIPSTALLIAALGTFTVLAAPAPSAEPPAGFEACIEAPNCEVYQDDNGVWDFRFVSGREPGTDWFVANTDESNPEVRERNLAHKKRQAEESFDCGGDICTGIWFYNDKVEYGTAMPRDVADGLWSNCYQFGCEVPSWEVDMWHAGQGGVMTMPRKIAVKPSGTFSPEARHALIFSLTDVMGAAQESFTRSGGSLRHGTWSTTMWSGPSRIHIARFINTLLQGELKVEFEHVQDGRFGCDFILGMLSPVAGRLSENLGTVLGQVTPFCGGL